MNIDYKSICDKEIIRLGNNARLIIKKKNLTDDDILILNNIYDELDFYSYHRTYKPVYRDLNEEYDYE